MGAFFPHHQMVDIAGLNGYSGKCFFMLEADGEQSGFWPALWKLEKLLKK